MASLYELLRNHSLLCPDPLLEELLSYLLIRFLSQLFAYIAYESPHNVPVRSIDPSVTAFRPTFPR